MPEGTYGSKEFPKSLDFEILEPAPPQSGRRSVRASIMAWVGISVIAWIALAWGLVRAAALLGS